MLHGCLPPGRVVLAGLLGLWAMLSAGCEAQQRSIELDRRVVELEQQNRELTGRLSSRDTRIGELEAQVSNLKRLPEDVASLLPEPVRLAVNTRLSGLVRVDARLVCRILFTPKDARNADVQMPGELHVRVLEEAAEGDLPLIGELALTPAELQDRFMVGPLGGMFYVVDVPLQKPPEASQVSLRMRYVSAVHGRQVAASVTLDAKLP